jgi:hypothetical protein
MPDRLRSRRCPACPFCGPSGRCLDPTIRSGRCGDWVWYVLPGNKQCRRLWVKPRDPRTPHQRHWRARLGAASRKYSDSLTDDQQDACIAAGAKLRSRPRLAQWGWLTGQQYWVSRECAGKAEERMKNAGRGAKGLQTQGISLPTWDPHRSISVVPPGHSRADTGRARKKEGRRKNEECRRQKERPGAEFSHKQEVTRFTREFYRTNPRVRRWQALSGLGTLPVLGRFRQRSCRWDGRAGGIESPWRWRRGAVGEERGPPERAMLLRETIQQPKCSLPS